MDTDVADMTAAEMAAMFRHRLLSPVEAAEAALDRIRRYNPAVNAFCLVDEETTLKAARAAEERHLRGESLGELDGVPVAIKDVFLTREWPTLKGSRTITPHQPWRTDAPAVAALRRHGAVPVGKTTTPEFGWKGVTDNPVDGITRNPWDISRTAGGSSGGSAAAIPLGMGVLALGTDAGGSIRIPAGFSGLFGHKPTHGRIPMWPGSPFGVLAHPGPMTKTVEDAALLMNVLTEPDRRDPSLPPDHTDYVQALGGRIAGLHIAFSADFGFVDVDPEIADAVAEAARVFESLGATVEAVDPGFPNPEESFERLFFGGAANALRDIDTDQRRLMDAGLVESAEAAAKMPLLEYLAAQNVRNELLEQMSRFHERFDLLLTPTLPIAAFEAGREVPPGWPKRRWPSWTPFTFPFNMTGQPASSVPCGFTSEGLPIGLQLVGARHQDALVLRAAHAFEQAQPISRRPPLLDTPGTDDRETIYA
ncbi:amidase [Thiohalomonas denitrificans]|uniref:Aspartyl-tRNA(Asn)/glutamyl-tRNA(Gln) amidotransferase subunit A n=1 Tax=Thiohalomonas denitrificans TaxID=415747 RepID=A0A1G5PVB2_9GAMM|nr:amidase [Thiohalomonas denitrificans]SCZ53514.1 aspartyl-tRNA(Asn)/glutamyl-tRNA(Gln) amidotransferase subunit A [Thiohalomonas denitrificans]